MCAYRKRKNNRFPKDTDVSWFKEYLEEQKDDPRYATVGRIKENGEFEAIRSPKGEFTLADKSEYFKRRKDDPSLTEGQRKYARKRYAQIKKQSRKYLKKMPKNLR